MYRNFTIYDKDSNYIGVIEISLKYKDGQPCFKVVGSMPGMSGQIVNSLGIKINSYCEAAVIDLRMEIKDMWIRYNLNDLHAGTKRQEDYLRKNGFENIDYDAACAVLRKANLLTDNGYKYGSSWLTRQIPLDDLKRIENLFVRKPPRNVIASNLSINLY